MPKDKPQEVKSIESILVVHCPILNVINNLAGLDVVLKLVDGEPFQIMCSEYRKIKMDKDIDESFDNYFCRLKDEKNNSCLYCNWKKL